MLGDDERIPEVRHVRAKNYLKHLLRKTSTAQEVYRAGNNAAKADTDETKIAVEGANLFAWLPNVKTMINQGFTKSETKKIFL